MTFGFKIMANQDLQKDESMKETMQKIQERVKAFYAKKMKPIMMQMMREQTDLLMLEGIRYMKEIIYLIWIVFSLS